MLIKQLFFSTFIVFSSFFNHASAKAVPLKKGFWTAKLQLNDSTALPFKLEVLYRAKQAAFIIHNDVERIELIVQKLDHDSIQLDFPQFHSYLRVHADNKKTLKGYWRNFNKGNNYTIPFMAHHGYADALPEGFTPLDLNGHWKAAFGPAGKEPDMAIGVFKTDQQQLRGTFMSETGDYRFLAGKAFNNQFYMSCFDGSYVFFFKGVVTNGQIKGYFYSGKHYMTPWEAVRDENFKLRDPDSITYLAKAEPFRFELKNLAGERFSFPNPSYVNKVVIIQIMGSWCPNCLDETRYFKTMYDKYHQQGLEIISVAYETPTNFDEQVQKVNMLKTRMNLDFQFLIGGQANKALASEQFAMLNKIISFPTAIFLNRKGEVVKIHTGFNGPGTGEVYQEYARETEAFIQSLLTP